MFKKKYIPFIVITLIILIGAFLRLYRIGDYMNFLGDEGRDVLIVKRMIVDHKFTLLGPITSVGMMYLGPIYYYFMVPFLWIFNLNPVGPAVMVALFSLATIYLIWQLGREFISEKAGIVAAVFYAASPLVIIHSHSSWNPNILPFFTLLIIYSLLKIVVNKNYKWLGVIGLSLGVSLQLHYVAFVFIPIIFLSLWLVRFKLPLKHVLLSIGGLFLVFLPFIIFEFRHQFINTQTVLQFITRGGDAKTFSLSEPLFKFWDLSVRLFWRLLIIKNAEISIVMMFLIIGICIYAFIKNYKNLNNRRLLQILGIWYLVGIGILSFYTGSIYDYYLMFAFPLPFILFGLFFEKISRLIIGKIFFIVLIPIILFFQIEKTPISQTPNRIATQTQDISEFIINHVDKEPFNFALIAGKNSDHAYRYFLEIKGFSPVIIENPTIDPSRKTVTNQLMIVCEEKICQPLGHPLWEIAGFGRAEIANEWQVGVVQVFKLVHYKSSLQ